MNWELTTSFTNSSSLGWFLENLKNEKTFKLCNDMVCANPLGTLSISHLLFLSPLFFLPLVLFP